MCVTFSSFWLRHCVIFCTYRIVEQTRQNLCHLYTKSMGVNFNCSLKVKWWKINICIALKCMFVTFNILLNSKINISLCTFCLWPWSLAVPVLAGWVYAFCASYVQELPKAQPALVLVLKRLRRRGNGLKSHPTDWGRSRESNLRPLVYKT